MLADYGWKPDKPDERDKLFQLPYDVNLPAAVDLRTFMPPVYDQGELGSCTAHAVSAAIEYELRKNVEGPFWSPSKLMLYYIGRCLEDTVEEDSGLEIRSVLKAAAKFGVCSEELWPYNIGRFADKPPKDCYKAASECRLSRYYRVSNGLSAIQTCLAAGWPIVAGINLFQSFLDDEVEKTGVLKVPRTDEEFHTGHAVLLVGYKNRTTTFIARNSFGLSWGRKGHLLIPYEYITHPQLCPDMWTLRMS